MFSWDTVCPPPLLRMTWYTTHPIEHELVTLDWCHSNVNLKLSCSFERTMMISLWKLYKWWKCAALGDGRKCLLFQPKRSDAYAANAYVYHASPPTYKTLTNCCGPTQTHAHHFNCPKISYLLQTNAFWCLCSQYILFIMHHHLHSLCLSQSSYFNIVIKNAGECTVIYYSSIFWN